MIGEMVDKGKCRVENGGKFVGKASEKILSAS